ncbi:hypothetical protein BC830DRAFT_1087806 [Chytriomyces sp. MP71]|nr:hypothetical protein BC830DRAFT_1087806 [Chytriomyces sp. MP71]
MNRISQQGSVSTTSPDSLALENEQLRQSLAKVTADLQALQSQKDRLELEIDLLHNAAAPEQARAPAEEVLCHPAGLDPAIATLIESMRADIVAKNGSIAALRAKVEALAAAVSPIQSIVAKKTADTIATLTQENKELYELLNNSKVEQLQVQLAQSKVTNLSLAAKLKETESLAIELDAELKSMMEVLAASQSGEGILSRKDVGVETDKSALEAAASSAE